MRPRLAPPGGLVVAVLTALVVALLPQVVARAVEPSVLHLQAPAQYADRTTPLTITLTSGGQPVADVEVTLERWDGAAWQPIGTTPPVTGATGAVTLPVHVSRTPARNRLRATYAGDTEHGPASVEYQLPLRALPTTTVISGPKVVVDERSVTLRVTWKTTEGTAAAGSVRLQRQLKGTWSTVATVNTNAGGYVDIPVRPRADSIWRAISTGNDWAARSISARHRIDNRPPGKVISLGKAPRPRLKLPAQPRATGAGPNPAIYPIPDAVWRSMVGRSWHKGCPVGRAQLRLLRINYWGFDGYRHRGELIAAASVIKQMAGALTAMYDAKLPIRSMYRVDRFGWSKTLQGADDYRSMRADNTSAFNCRWVVGRKGVRSPHSYGRSLDVNPWENPYRSSHGWTPNGWWPSRSHPQVAWRSRNHQVVKIMARNGLRWTYGYSDLHHFDAVPRGARLVVPSGCEQAVCH